jgi:uncharacterized protein YoxC
MDWNYIWLGIIAIAVAATSGYVISLIIELKKTLNSVNVLLITTEENLKPTLEELQQTLKSLRNVSDDINEVTSDVKVLSKSVRDVGENVSHVSGLISTVTSLAAMKASGLRAGVKAGMGVLISNFFSRIGGGK